VGGLVASFIGAVGIVHYLVRREPSADETVVLGRLPDFPVGEFQRRTFTVTEHGTWFEGPVEKTVWVRRNADDTLLVFTATCPHRNCLVNLEETVFHCPCHHSRFDLEGKVIVPPALRSLDTLEYRISKDGVVSVQFQNFKREIAAKELVPFS
jgi:Rieske Fe-S protein